MCALYVNTAREGGAPAPEDTNIRDLVENCAHNDDVTPLVRLVFEAQAVPEDPTSINADGQQMVSIIGACLKAVAADQERVISDIAHGNATGIATTVAEVEKLTAAVAQVKATLTAGNDSVQASGGALVEHVEDLSAAAEVQDNLARAAHALAAARSVLQQCLAAGRLISEGRLYHALCSLELIRRKHLGALQSMLSLPAPGGPDAPRRLDALSRTDQARLSRLHAFFSALVDDLGASARQLAVSDFNDWLVSVRTAARDVGMNAIRTAASERKLEEDLAGERRAALAALASAAAAAAATTLTGDGAAAAAAALAAGSSGAAAAASGGSLTRRVSSSAAGLAGDGGAGTCTAIGEVLACSEFRQDLLHDSAPDGGSSGGGGAPLEGDAGAGGLLASLRALASSGVGSSSGAAAAAAGGGTSGGKSGRSASKSARAHEEDESEARAAPLPSADLEALHPGDPESAIDAVLRRHGISADGSSGSGGGKSAVSSRVSVMRATPGSKAGRESGGGGGGLLSLELGGLHRAVHIHRCLGEVEAFRAHYFEQRRLQLATDMAPPANFLESYQPYLASLTGFFAIESYLERASDGFVLPGQRAALWDGALRGLKGTLEGALERMGCAEEMLLVKDFVVLVCSALQGSGYQVAPVLEILTAGTSRYNDILGKGLAKALSEAVAADSLEHMEVRTLEQHRHLVDELGLPVVLEGAALSLARRYVADSASYLRGLYQPWELLPALFAARDRVLAKALPEALTPRVAAAAPRARVGMKLAADAWALRVALDALDGWTIQQARLRAASAGGIGLGGGGSSSSARDAAGGADGADGVDSGGGDGGAAARARARQLKALVAAAGTASALQAALRGAQDAAEKGVLATIAGRVDELLDGGRRAPAAEWVPAVALPEGNSSWVASLVSSLQETFEAGQQLLPRPAVATLMRESLRAAAAAIMRLLGPEGVAGYTLHAIARLAADVRLLERFAGRWGVPGLPAELAAPTQLCALLLSNQLEDALSPVARSDRFSALDSPTIAAALDRYREIPNQAKKEPTWPPKKTAEAVAKQLRAQVAAAAAGSCRGGVGAS